MQNAMIHYLSGEDLAALGAFVVLWAGYELFGYLSTRRGVGLPAVMRGWRRDWFHAALPRENRIIDIQIIHSLSNNSAFLASTSILVVGGLFAVLGAAEQAVKVLNGFDFLTETTQNRFGLKIVLLIFIFTYAFFRVAWSIRLHSNAAVVLGSIPQPEIEAERAIGRVRAEVAATLVTLAARHYNGAVHSYYFGLAVCAWFLHPFAFVGATLWVVAILYRREFRSNSLAALSAGR